MALQGGDDYTCRFLSADLTRQHVVNATYERRKVFCYSCAMLVLFLVYPGVSNKIFRVFVCDTFDASVTSSVYPRNPIRHGIKCGFTAPVIAK